jgi:hypothetical protein
MTRTIRLIMLVEATAFVLASLAHFDLWLDGYAHRRAAIAESIIATVLVVGLVSSFARPSPRYGMELAAQIFALVGTLVGVFTIVIGIGPRTTPDIIYHGAIIAILVGGIALTVKARNSLLRPRRE